MPPVDYGAAVPRRHFGNVRKLPSGRWQASFWHEEQRHTAPNTFQMKADALVWLSNAETDIGRGAWVDPLAGKATLAEYLLDWLEARSDLKKTTRAKYTTMNKHVFPQLGSATPSGLTPSKVRSWYHELGERHRTTADDAYRLLRAVMNTAKADRMVVANPCQVKGAGQVRSPERPVASLARCRGCCRCRSGALPTSAGALCLVPVAAR